MNQVEDYVSYCGTSLNVKYKKVLSKEVFIGLHAKHSILNYGE